MTQQNTNRAVVRIKTALQRQRRMVLYLLIAVAVLGVALGLTLFFTSRTPFLDPTDGTKYYVAKEDDVYVLKSKDGKVMSTTSDGNYVTVAGTIVHIDDETGEFSTVAAVLIEDGETVRFDTSENKYDVLLYPLLERADIGTIEVCNKNGSFKFGRIEVEKDGERDVQFIIKTRPDLAVDETALFATLVYFTGRTQTLLRLDTSRVKELGYAEYGLPENPDDATQYFVITALNGTSHKVIIGDEVPSGNGYFVRYATREAVYVISDLTKSEYNGTFAEALLGRVEDYINPPTVSYTMESTTYYDVSDFTLHKNGSAKPIIGFSYRGSIEKRNNTFYSSLPYITDSDLSGYTVNTASAENLMYTLYTWEPDFVVKLGDDETFAEGADLNEWLKPYGLDVDSYAYQLSFIFNRVRTYNKETGKDTVKRADQEKHLILISEKQEDGYYYAYNICYEYDAEAKDFSKLLPGYNMIVALDESQLNFLFFTTKDWISPDLFSGSISYLEEASIKIAPGMVSQYPAGYSEVFALDNSETLEELAKNPSTSSIISTDKLIVRDSKGKVLNTMQFKRFYQTLLYTTCPGYSSLSDTQKQAHISSGTEGAALVIKLRYVLRELNQETGYYEETGEVIEREYCFYENLSAPLQYFTTVNGVGDFYMTTSRIKKLLSDTMKLYATPETDPIDYGSLK